ncbi:MAG: alpha/beta hydrolase [Rhizobiales bacterium]|nr:alpha/beta hydrolase [Hyphomicrobiales bacterium]
MSEAISAPDPGGLADFDDLEFHYNPRVATPEAAALIADWDARASIARALSPPQTLRYGRGARETIDVFRPARPRGTLLFIHGGYWRALAKEQFSWLAPPWVEAGVTVALMEYPLCPAVSVAQIAQGCRRGLSRLVEALTPAERRIAVAGHSAGGYLAADLLTADWASPPPLAGVLSISGVFDPAPLIATSINADIRLTPESARDLSLLAREPRLAAPLALAVGELEPEAFHRQSDALASRWHGLTPERLTVDATNHFTVLEPLVDPASQLWRRLDYWLWPRLLA